MDNLFHYGASHILQRIDPSVVQHAPVRTEIEDAAQSLFAALGLPCSARGLSDGTLALALLCGLLREHGGALWFNGKGPARHPMDPARMQPPAGGDD